MASSVAADRIARAILHEGNPKMRFDVVDENEARRALADHFPGHMLQDMFDVRAHQLAIELERVQSVITYLYNAVGLAELQMALAS